jgi:tetratricopeptide (TPR) repeat protein
MRVYYRNGDFSKVSQQFAELSKPNVPDSLRFHAAYLQGQAYLQSKETNKAIELFSIVPDLHPDYIYAQHAIAISLSRLSGDLNSVVPHLENCISSTAVTEGQKEIINRSYVFLGYIFYEDNAVSKAVVALRMVPTTSHYAEDALLGQGWTALKARQWNDCILTGQLLKSSTNKPILQCEGMLIEAYGYLLQKNYGSALSTLKKAMELGRTITVLDKDSLDYRRMQYESTRASHDYLADQIDNFAKVSQASTKSNQMDSLKLEHTEFIKKFDEYYDFTEDFGRSTFFTRNIEQVLNDVEYALATVEKISGSSNVIEEQQKLNEKQVEIDKEIEQLKKEMEKLQSK